MLLFEELKKLSYRHIANVGDFDQLGAASIIFSAIGIPVFVALHPIALPTPIATRIFEIVFFDCQSYRFVKEIRIGGGGEELQPEDRIACVARKPEDLFFYLVVHERIAEGMGFVLLRPIAEAESVISDDRKYSSFVWRYCIKIIFHDGLLNAILIDLPNDSRSL
jgi:hypothetical protein